MHQHFQTINPDSYRLPAGSDEPRCTLGDGMDLIRKFHGLASEVPLLEPVGGFATPMGGNPQLGIVTIDSLIAAGAKLDDDSFALVIRYKVLDAGTTDQISEIDPNWRGVGNFPLAEAVDVFKNGKSGQLKDFFDGLRGQPGTGGHAIIPDAGLADYTQFMSQRSIHSAVVTAMTAGLAPAPPAPLGIDWTIPAGAPGGPPRVPRPRSATSSAAPATKRRRPAAAGGKGKKK